LMINRRRNCTVAPKMRVPVQGGAGQEEEEEEEQSDNAECFLASCGPRVEPLQMSAQETYVIMFLKSLEPIFGPKTKNKNPVVSGGTL
jgi:hypothetical protein